MAAATKEQILDAIAEMKIMEIADLIKAMEEKFGVTAAAPVAAAAAGAAPAAAAVPEAPVEAPAAPAPEAPAPEAPAPEAAQA